MKDLRRMMTSELASIPPLDGIVVMCDSDITDVVFDVISDQKKADLLAAYKEDLTHLIRAAQNASVPIAVSSPVGVLTEGPLGAPDSVRYHYKAAAVNSYTAATKSISLSMGVPYVDIREATLSAIPKYRKYYCGYTPFAELTLLSPLNPSL
jgi:hypothetical protein